LQQRYTQEIRPIALCRVTSTSACSLHWRLCWIRLSQQESCAQVLRPKTCYEQSQPYATDPTATSPSMREEWSHCWQMACVTERAHQ